jgi:TRAP transporter TAXI family solute receptor
VFSFAAVRRPRAQPRGRSDLLALLAVALAACTQPTGGPAITGPDAKATPATAGESGRPAASPAVGASPAADTPSTVRVPAGTRLSIATGGTGGVYFPLGGGLASMLEKHLGTQVTAEETPASVDNMKLVNDHRTDLVAFTLADTAYYALQGRERRKETGPIAVRSLGIIYANFMHLVTTEGSGINTVADLRGKRVSVGAPGSGTEVKTNRVLEAYGLDPASDIQRDRLSVAESAGALKDRKLDAFFWDGGLPTGAVTDLANTPGLTIKLIPHGDAVPRMRAKYGPFYTVATIPKDTYQGLAADVEVAGSPNILAVHEEFPEDVAYAVLATIFDHRDEWNAIHPEAKNTSLEAAPRDNPVPLHPGAIRFYRERGVYQGS